MTARKRIKINHYPWQCVVIASSTISVSARGRANVPSFILVHRYLSSTHEEKRFVSRLTPMNTGLPLKNDRAPPVAQRMQLPRAPPPSTRRQGVRVWIRIHARGTLRRSFLGNIISLGVIEKARCVDICRIEQMFFFQLRDISSQDITAENGFVHPFNISCNRIVIFRGYSLCSFFFSIIRFPRNFSTWSFRKNYKHRYSGNKYPAFHFGKL